MVSILVQKRNICIYLFDHSFKKGLAKGKQSTNLCLFTIFIKKKIIKKKIKIKKKKNFLATLSLDSKKYLATS